jgi:hypothetical protein
MDLADTALFVPVVSGEARFGSTSVRGSIVGSGHRYFGNFAVLPTIRRAIPAPETLYAIAVVDSFYLDTNVAHYTEGDVLGYPRVDCDNMVSMRVYRGLDGSLDFSDLGSVRAIERRAAPAVHAAGGDRPMGGDWYTMGGQRCGAPRSNAPAASHGSLRVLVAP